MKIIVGLGNPGSKYVHNRHNVGHMVVEKLQKSKTPKIKAFKSDKFMNDSGSFVLKLTNRYPLITNPLFIIHDDLDIKLGEFKIQFGKGPKVHNGLNDIYEKLGTNEFWHVRVGIDNRTEDQRQNTEGKDYVLEDFTEEEKVILDGVIKQICNQLEV